MSDLVTRWEHFLIFFVLFYQRHVQLANWLVNIHSDSPKFDTRQAGCQSSHSSFCELEVSVSPGPGYHCYVGARHWIKLCLSIQRLIIFPFIDILQRDSSHLQNKCFFYFNDKNRSLKSITNANLIKHEWYKSILITYYLFYLIFKF